MPVSRRTNSDKRGGTNQKLADRSPEKTRTRYSLDSAGRLAVILLLSSLVGYFAVHFGGPGGDNLKRQANGRDETVKEGRAQAERLYKNCTISYVPPTPRAQADFRKPLWVPSLPGSGSASPSRQGDIVKTMIDSITGLKAGTKNYHMSGPQLRRCKANTETVACTQGHPYVPVEPEKRTKDFQSSVIHVIRNVAASFPAAHTDKSIAYHNGDGQVSEEAWRDVRDEYLMNTLQTYQDMLDWWRSAEYYHVSLYLPFEWLMSPTKGPPLVQKLADELKAAGFDVAPPEDIPCVWYKSVKSEWVRQEALTKYTAGYRKAQQQLIVDKYEEMMQKTEDDPILTEILKEYRDDVLVNTRIDDEASETTVA